MEKIEIDDIRASLYPVPVTLVTTGSIKSCNIITISWTGVLSSKPPTLYISVRPERFSYNNIKNDKRFVINIPSLSYIDQVDYCGSTSGKSVNKFANCKFTSKILVDGYPPIIDECEHHLFCDVIGMKALGTHTMFISVVKKEYIKKEYYDTLNKSIKYEMINPIAYCRKEYFSLIKENMKYGFSIQ